MRVGAGMRRRKTGVTRQTMRWIAYAPERARAQTGYARGRRARAIMRGWTAVARLVRMRRMCLARACARVRCAYVELRGMHADSADLCARAYDVAHQFTMRMRQRRR